MTAKRLFDLLASTLGIIAVSPLFAVAAGLIACESGRPIFFRQERVGRHGKTFRIYKFRTMHRHAEESGQLTVAADPRITRVGAFLRRYKLDELPQLINVFRGEMSFVGPRPEIPKYVAAYPDKDRELVLSVRPGITDNASIRFRNENELLDGAEDPDRIYREVILPTKLAYYREYVRHANVWTDLVLILRTVCVLIAGAPPGKEPNHGA